MKKQDLVLLIVKAATYGCKNHVLRMHILNQLADRDKQPMRYLIYEVDQDNNWHVKLI